MHPILLHHPFVTTYGVMLLVGLAAAWIIARPQSRRFGIDPSHLDLLAPLLVASGLLGALAFGYFTDSLTGRPEHGRVLIGALLIATFTGIAYCFIARIPLGKMGDTFAPSLAVGITAGRVGCYFAGCCWGSVCPAVFPLAVSFPSGSFAHRQHVTQGLIAWWTDRSLPVHPTQLYEAAALVVLALVLALLMRRPRVSGERFLAFSLAYAAIRFSIEFFRADNPPVLRGLTFSQVSSAAIACLAVATLLIRRRYARRWHLYSADDQR